MVKLPKNIRQIGTGGGDVKIYVEDYVETWLHQYAEDALTGCAAAVFVGERIKTEDEKTIFLYGAVKADCILDGKIQFTESVWTEIYQEIKKYFPDGEIMGWFLGGPSFLLEADTVRKVHADHFSGPDKVLMKYDALEREESFYLSGSGNLVKQEGYYIYYDRNEGMQSYMVDHKRAERSIEADFPDNTTKKIRAAVTESKIRAEKEKTEKEAAGGKESRQGRQSASAGKSFLQEKVEKLRGDRTPGTETDAAPLDEPAMIKKPDRPVKGMKGLMYAAGTLAAAVMLIIGASMLNRYENMKKDPDSVSVLAGQTGTKGTSEPDSEKNGGRPGTEAGSEAGSKVQTDSETQTESKGGSQSENQSQAQSEDQSQLENQSETQAENQSQAQSENQSETQAENQSQAQSENQSGTQAENQSQAQSENQNSVQPGSEAATQSEPETDAQKGSQSGKDNAEETPQEKEEGGSEPNGGGKETGKENGAENGKGNGSENSSDGGKETSGTPAKLNHYTVEKGDTLLGIALRLYHSADYIQKIKDLNDIKDENLIYIGQTLIVP